LFAIIDIETTGHSYKFGKITEIALYQHNGQEVTHSFSTLINPEMDIPYFITELTGIDNEMVKNAPKFYEVAKTIVELTQGRTFVAHNVSFDYNFIKEEYNKLGYNYMRKTMCTVKLSRKLLPGHGSYSLGKLCSDLNIEINGRHRAAGDALATVKLFEILLQKNKLIGNPKAVDNFKLF
jgi:DNA polymerase-3 subunit epsilon